MPRLKTVLLLTCGTLAGIAGAVALLTRDVEITSWKMIWNSVSGSPGPRAETATVKQHLSVPAGWQIGLYADAVPEARVLRLTEAGDLLVSQPRLGQITLLGRDANGDGHPDSQSVLMSGLDRPHGVEVSGGFLYVGETGAVGRAPFDVQSGRITGDYTHVITGLPEGGNHWSRSVRIGPDGWLYVHVGSSCNSCIEDHPWRATLLRARPDGSELAVYASGLRNSVGFDWTPWSDELFATDNGRDLLGDDFPPCELNRIVQGGFYGWPFVNGFNVLDPDNGAGHESALQTALPPAHGFHAHNAPLGIRFLRHQQEPALARSALVALHGSWNRSKADGYTVVRLDWAADGTISEAPFISGFEKAGTVIGRPVDIAESPAGELFVSDDYAGAVYRLWRGEAESASTTVATAPAKPAVSTDPLADISATDIAAATARAEPLLARFACAGCHAPGTPMGDKLLSLSERYTVGTLSAYFITPRPPMPVYPLSEEDRRALSIHLLSRAAQSSSGSPANSAPTPASKAS